MDNTGGVTSGQVWPPYAVVPIRSRCECHDCTQARDRERNPFHGLQPAPINIGTASPLPNPVVMQLS